MQDPLITVYTQPFDVVSADRGFSPEDDYALIPAVAHPELGGPADFHDLEPLHRSGRLRRSGWSH